MPRRLFIIIILVLMAVIFEGLAAPVFAFEFGGGSGFAESDADDAKGGWNYNTIDFTPGISIPGSNFQAGTKIEINTKTIGEYIKAIYTFSIYAGSIVAVVVLMIGGFIWLTAAGNVTQVGQAKTYIGGAISGIVLLLLSWTLLQTINPALVQFKPLSINATNNIPIHNESPVGFDSRCCIFYQNVEEPANCGGESLCVYKIDSAAYPPGCPEESGFYVVDFAPSSNLVNGQNVAMDCQASYTDQGFSAPLCSACQN